MSFMIETSARHIHLTQETVEKLFGEGYQLTVRKPLSYPGQYACNERLTIVGPKKEMANVSILGPVRKADQVEVSATDARTLGIDAPVRESGHVEGSGACKLIGPKGEVELSQGVIIAKRHLHVRQEDAEKMGVKDKEIIKVACGGEGRKLIFDDVVVRELKFQRGIRVYAATEKAEKFYTGADLTLPTAIIMGSEDKGIDEELINIATDCIKIPQKGQIESLNVSAAAAVLLFEVVRQRG